MNSLYSLSLFIMSLVGQLNSERQEYERQLQDVQKTKEELRAINTREKEILSPYRLRLQRHQDESLKIINTLSRVLSTLSIDNVDENRVIVAREIEDKFHRKAQVKRIELEDNTYVILSKPKQVIFYIPLGGEVTSYKDHPRETLSPVMEKVYGESYWVSDQVVIQIGEKEALVAIETAARIRGVRDEHTNDWFISFESTVYEMNPYVRLALEYRLPLVKEASPGDLSLSDFKEAKYVASIESLKMLTQDLLKIQERKIYTTREAIKP